MQRKINESKIRRHVIVINYFRLRIYTLLYKVPLVSQFSAIELEKYLCLSITYSVKVSRSMLSDLTVFQSY